MTVRTGSSDLHRLIRNSLLLVSVIGILSAMAWLIWAETDQGGQPTPVENKSKQVQSGNPVANDTEHDPTGKDVPSQLTGAARSNTDEHQGQTRLPARLVQPSTSDSSPEGLRSVVEGFLHSDRADELLKKVVSRDGEKEGARVSELLTTGAPIASYLFPRRNLTERTPISPDDLRLQTWYFPLLHNGKEVAMVSAGAGDTIESVTCTGPLWPPSAFRLPKAKDTMGASPGRIVISTVPFRLKCFGVMDDSQKIDAASFVCTALDWGQAGGGVMSDTLRFHEICQLAQTFFDKNLRAMYESGNFGDGWK